MGDQDAGHSFSPVAISPVHVVVLSARRFHELFEKSLIVGRKVGHAQSWRGAAAEVKECVGFCLSVAG